MDKRQVIYISIIILLLSYLTYEVITSQKRLSSYVFVDEQNRKELERSLQVSDSIYNEYLSLSYTADSLSYALQSAKKKFNKPVKQKSHEAKIHSYYALSDTAKISFFAAWANLPVDTFRYDGRNYNEAVRQCESD